MGTVTPLTIPPKSDTFRHRRIEYTVTYVPDTKQWEWAFTVTTSMTYSAAHGSFLEAMHTAREIIDNVTGVPCQTS